MTTKTKTFLVTGASGGIGRAITQTLLNAGHHVIGIGRDLTKLPTPGDRFTAVELDLAKIKQLPDKLTDIAQKHPNINGLIFCAGQGRFGSLEEFSYQQISTLMDINFTSTAYACRALVPLMKKNGGGEIIVIGSEAALEGSKMGSIYCAGKFALRGFTQALRAECANAGLRVTLINPGMVKTAFFDQLSFKPGDAPENYIEAGDIAETVTMVIDSRPGTNFDEINLSPLKKVINFNKK